MSSTYVTKHDFEDIETILQSLSIHLSVRPNVRSYVHPHIRQFGKGLLSISKIGI